MSETNKNEKRIGGRGQEVTTPEDLRTRIARVRAEELAAEAARGDRPQLMKREPVLPDYAREPNIAPTIGDRIDASGLSHNRHGGTDESTLYRDPVSGRIRPFRPGERERMEREKGQK
jgi:hypothetical protein